MALTVEQRLDRLEQAIIEIYDVLESVADRDWPEDSKVKEIVNQ